ERARAGIIVGAKPGKEWRFLEDDLVAYLRSLQRCHSIDDRIRPSGISTSAILAADALDDLLGPPSGKRRSVNTTSLRLVSGKSSKPAANSPTPCSPGPRRKRAARAT